MAAVSVKAGIIVSVFTIVYIGIALWLYFSRKRGILAGLIAFSSAYDPVSYTHLDVYKRQVPFGHSGIRPDIALISSVYNTTDSEKNQVFCEHLSAVFVAGFAISMDCGISGQLISLQ